MLLVLEQGSYLIKNKVMTSRNLELDLNTLQQQAYIYSIFASSNLDIHAGGLVDCNLE